MYTLMMCVFIKIYYESINRELKRRPINECRCDERLKTKTEEFTRLAYTGFLGGLEHLKIETRLIDEKIPNEMVSMWLTCDRRPVWVKCNTWRYSLGEHVVHTRFKQRGEDRAGEVEVSKLFGAEWKRAKVRVKNVTCKVMIYYIRIKKGEGQEKNFTLETMMHSKPVKLWT
jgi:hypothetical protein